MKCNFHWLLGKTHAVFNSECAETPEKVRNVSRAGNVRRNVLLSDEDATPPPTSGAESEVDEQSSAKAVTPMGVKQHIDIDSDDATPMPTRPVRRGAPKSHVN